MLSNRLKLLKSESGSIAPIFALSLLPLLLAVGLSVDYTSATTTKADMQSALDAASLSIVTMPKGTSRPDREKALQVAFLGNGGEGTTTLNAFSIAADGTVNLQASATYAMPTNFMQLAMVRSVPLGVQASVSKTPALVNATFNVDVVSGWWDKTLTLYGTKFNETKAKKLMEIKYSHNRYGDPKGYGTTILSKMNNNVMTFAQKKECKTNKVSDFKGASADDIKETASDGRKYLIKCTTTTDPSAEDGAEIDVSLMETLYLEMDIPSPNPGLGGGKLDNSTLKTLRSNDPTTSDRLFYQVDTKMVQATKGTYVDIFTIVPCGVASKQAWEDGGSLRNDAAEVDFSYFVTGKCDFNKRPSGTVLTQ